MANALQSTAKSVSSVEILGARLQKIIRSQSAQEAQCALVHRAPDEDPRDWDQIIAAIEETDGVHVTTHEDGSVHISWDVPDKIKRAGNQVQQLREHSII